MFWKRRHITDFTKVTDRNKVLINQLLTERYFFDILGDISGKRILDVGCGSGQWTKMMADKGASVTGIDINPKNIEEAKELYQDGLQFIVADASEYSSDEPYDIATAVFMLNEVSKEKIEAVVNNIGRNLIDHGHFVFLILHPAFTHKENTNFIQRTGLTEKDYFNEGKLQQVTITLSDGEKISTIDHHYSLDFIFSLLSKANLAVKRIAEVRDEENKMGIYSAFPFYIVGEAVKYSVIPNTRSIEGFNDVKEYYYSINKTLSKGEEVLVFGARSGNPKLKKAVEFFYKYIEDRAPSGIRTKLIFNDYVQEIGDAYKKLANTEVRYMPKGLVTPISVNIYRDTIDLLDWTGKEPKVLVIKDQKFADSYRDYFNFLWSSTALMSDLATKGTYWLTEVLFEEFLSATDEKEVVMEALLGEVKKVKDPEILQIGAGFNDFTIRLGEHSKHLTIIEKNTSYAQSYKESSKLKVLNTDFETYVPNHQYDLAVLSHVLFYFPNANGAISKVLSCLKPDGKAIFVLNHPSGDYKKLKDLLFNNKYVYSYDKLINEIKATGLTFDEMILPCKIRCLNDGQMFRAMRFWFEMDLQRYQDNEELVKRYIKDHTQGGSLSFNNVIVTVTR